MAGTIGKNILDAIKVAIESLKSMNRLIIRRKDDVNNNPVNV